MLGSVPVGARAVLLAQVAWELLPHGR